VSIREGCEVGKRLLGEQVTLKHIPGPLGVRGRSLENSLIKEKLGWRPTRPLREGLEKTYRWIEAQGRGEGCRAEAVSCEW